MKIKKYLSLILILSFITLSMTGCNGKTPKNYGLSKDSPIEISLWHYYNGAQAIALDELVQEFNATVGTETGIIVVAQSKSSVEDLNVAVTDSVDKKVGAEDMPNIFQSYLDLATKMDEKGVLTDLNQYVTESEKSEYIDSYVQEGVLSQDGSWKLFPMAKSIEILTINKTDWDKFAAETEADVKKFETWEGISELSEQYYNWSGGKSFFGRDAFANYMIIGSKQLGTEIFNVQNGKAEVQLDKTIMKKLWDNFYIPYVKGYFGHTGRYRSDDIKIGKLISSVGSTTGITYFPKQVSIGDNEPYSIDYLVLPVPDFKGTDSYVVQQGASMAVTKTTPKEEYASVMFLKWFTQADRNIHFSINSGYLPVKKEANNIEKIDQYSIDNNIAFSPIQKEAIKVSIEQVANSKLYTSNGFEGGDEARNVLNKSMLNLAVQDRKLIVDAVGSGISEEAALKKYLTDEYFSQWYDKFKNQLDKICED